MTIRQNIANAHVNGQINAKIADMQQQKSLGSNFKPMVILDVICDPTEISQPQLDYWKNTLNVSNMEYAAILPRNTVIAQEVGIDAAPMFIFPFFPSHISFPCKPGEMVWAMVEVPDADDIDVGYWMCKVVHPHFADDVNHTHPARVLEISTGQEKAQIMKRGSPAQVNELRNGKKIADSSESPDLSGATSVSSILLQSNNEYIFEDAVTKSRAASISQWEAIPRFKKRPGDLALEGSNNTLIVLGTDRVGSHAIYDPDTKLPIYPTSDIVSGSSGAIDIVAGRGQTSQTLGVVADTTSIMSAGDSPIVLKKEIAKSAELLKVNEGDPDFTNDRSRILVSQRTKVDENFKLSEHNAQKLTAIPTVQDSVDGNAAIVIKSDKIRLIARSDVQIIVTGNQVSAQENTGINIMNESEDINSWASITVKSNGDIVFTPSQKGVIKLGGDDADKAILCTSKIANNNEGTIKPQVPIATTAGGFIGTTGGLIDSAAIARTGPADLGTFSSKVLVK